MLYIKDNYNEIYNCSAEIRSVSEDSSKPIRTVAIRIVRPTTKFTNKQIVVNIPNVRKPIPLFIVMRALGIESDKKIIEYCLLDLEKYNTYLELFIPSIHDAGRIFTQTSAIKYIATFTKGKTISHVLEILMNYFLPHIGDSNLNDKAFFVGHMVKELLKVYTKEKKPTDRDSFKYKRVDLTGYLLYDLFKEYYTLQQRNIYQTIDKEYYYKQGLYQKNFTALIENNYKDIFKDRIVETGFKKAFKGNWGSQSHTKKSGVVQDLNRLSFNSYLSHLRKINLPLDAATKIIGPRLLHSSQWGLIDPVDTPDGGNIGLHKHMAMGTYITSFCSKFPLINLLKNNFNLKLLSESSIQFIANTTKVFINGDWIGMLEFPIPTITALKHYRRLGLIPVYTSIVWEKETNTIFIYTDSGRLTRPIFYINDKTPSYKRTPELFNKLLDRNFSWNELLTGFNTKKKDTNDICLVYNDTKELYGTNSIEDLINNEGIIEYLDTSEEEGSLICMDEENIEKLPYTNIEIHPSLIFGVMGNLIAYPENSQLPRDLFSCGQSKQKTANYLVIFSHVVKVNKLLVFIILII
jgi:DNA-directed RNA polymerase II subunit RPB2